MGKSDFPKRAGRDFINIGPRRPPPSRPGPAAPLPPPAVPRPPSGRPPGRPIYTKTPDQPHGGHYVINKRETLFLLIHRAASKQGQSPKARAGGSGGRPQGGRLERATPRRTGGATATTAAAEEFPATTRPHPIMRRDSIPRSGNPSLRCIYIYIINTMQFPA